jgi:predicted N-acetyltransferase YhbS
MDQSVRIETLAGRPEWVGLLARWHVAQWQSLYPGWTVAAAEEELLRHGDPNRIPLTLVAVEGMDPVGSVSVVEKDLDGWDHLTPWLASLYVRPDRRGRGIGKALVLAAVAEARRLGEEVLYLFTPGQEKFYADLDWHIVAHTRAEGEAVTVMSRRL